MRHIARFTIVLLTLSSAAPALEAPQLSIQAAGDLDSTYAQLSWPPVAGADTYLVYGRDSYAGGDSLYLETADTSAVIAVPLDWGEETPTRLRLFTVRADSSDVPFGMVAVPPGTFTMGRTGVASPEHEVTLTNEFYIGINELTNLEYVQALQWAYAMGYVIADETTVTRGGWELVDLDDEDCEITFSGGSFGLREAPNSLAPAAYPEGYDPAYHPVKEVSLMGAAEYCDWLSELDGLTPYYLGDYVQSLVHNPYLSEGYRLPTEAEWEYTARFNDGRDYPWGNASPTCDTANFRNGAYCVGWTAPVGDYPLGASYLGLRDLAGNVYEWTGDIWGNYGSDPETDPLGYPVGFYYIPRGGAYYVSGEYLHTFQRGQMPMTYTEGHIGFRICRSHITE